MLRKNSARAARGRNHAHKWHNLKRKYWPSSARFGTTSKTACCSSPPPAWRGPRGSTKLNFKSTTRTHTSEVKKTDKTIPINTSPHPQAHTHTHSRIRNLSSENQCREQRQGPAAAAATRNSWRFPQVPFHRGERSGQQEQGMTHDTEMLSSCLSDR